MALGILTFLGEEMTLIGVEPGERRDLGSARIGTARPMDWIRNQSKLKREYNTDCNDPSRLKLGNWPSQRVTAAQRPRYSPFQDYRMPILPYHPLCRQPVPLST